MTRCCLVLAALLLLVQAVPVARADDADDEQARIYYENGERLYAEGRYEDALAAWNEAYRLSQRPLLLYNMANAEERVGRYREALDHLNRYRAFADPSERDVLDRRIANLERRLAETPPATTATPTTTTQPVEEERPVRILPIALYGVGGAGLLAGGVLGGLALGARSEALASCQETAGGVYCTEGARTAIQRDQTLSLLADISFGVGALGVIGGTLSLLLPGENTSLSVGPNHLILQGQF